jgi:sulfur carrier protein ThiS
VIALTIRGAARSFPAPLNVTQLIEPLELAGKRVALERNSG